VGLFTRFSSVQFNAVNEAWKSCSTTNHDIVGRLVVSCVCQSRLRPDVLVERHTTCYWILTPASRHILVYRAYQIAKLIRQQGFFHLCCTHFGEFGYLKPPKSCDSLLFLLLPARWIKMNISCYAYTSVKSVIYLWKTWSLLAFCLYFACIAVFCVAAVSQWIKIYICKAFLLEFLYRQTDTYTVARNYNCRNQMKGCSACGDLVWKWRGNWWNVANDARQRRYSSRSVLSDKRHIIVLLPMNFADLLSLFNRFTSFDQKCDVVFIFFLYVLWCRWFLHFGE